MLELRCQYLHPSFSEFRENIRYEHCAPLFSRLILVERGYVELKFPSGKEVRILPGEIYYLPSNHPFESTYCDSCVTRGFHLYLRNLFGLIIGPSLPDVMTTREEALVSLLRYAIRTNPPGMIHSALMVILTQLLKEHLPELSLESALSPICRKVMERIRENPSLELSFSALAEEFHISLSSLSKQFRKALKQTPQEYRSRLLLEQARHLLEESKLTASEVAARLGYRDTNAFFVFFKKHMGMPPLVYRRKVCWH